MPILKGRNLVLTSSTGAGESAAMFIEDSKDGLPPITSVLDTTWEQKRDAPLNQFGHGRNIVQAVQYISIQVIGSIAAANIATTVFVLKHSTIECDYPAHLPIVTSSLESLPGFSI